jgi:GNAT superfamily N-acetyltransferase
MQPLPPEGRSPADAQPMAHPPGMHHPGAYPLAVLITEAAAGRFPAADGGWRRVPPWRSGLEGIVAFTGHAVLAVAPDISDERLVELGASGLGGAHDPRLVAALAGPDGWIDSLDVLLAGHGTGKAPRAALRPGHGAGAAAGGAGSADGRAGGTGAGPRLVDRPDLAAHPRAQFAAQIRDRRRVLGYPDRGRSALAVISTGLAGLTELGFELEPEHRGAGGGAALIRDALSTVPAGELVVAACAPGNAASLRALLTTGFSPLGSLQLFRRAPLHDPFMAKD